MERVRVSVWGLSLGVERRGRGGMELRNMLARLCS